MPAGISWSPQPPELPWGAVPQVAAGVPAFGRVPSLLPPAALQTMGSRAGGGLRRSHALVECPRPPLGHPEGISDQRQ